MSGQAGCDCFKDVFGVCDSANTDTPLCSAQQAVTYQPDLPGFGGDNAWVFLVPGAGSVGVLQLAQPVQLDGAYDQLSLQAYSLTPSPGLVTLFLLISGSPTDGVVLNDYMAGGQFTSTTSFLTIPLSAWGPGGGDMPEGELTGIRLESEQAAETYYDNLYLSRSE